MPTREQFLEIYRYVRHALKRHWLKAGAVSAVVALLAFAGAMLMPRSYYSEARLFVRFGRENLVDPTATGGQMVSLYESRESEINSLIEILKSRNTLDRVVESLGPNYILRGTASAKPSSKETITAAAATNLQGPPSRAHQQAIMQLERDISTYPARKTNIITVTCKASSPAVAQTIVAKLVDVYLEEHLRVHRSPGSYAFFEEQTARSQAAWRDAAGKLREAKTHLGIVTIEGQRKKLEDQIADTDSKLLANQADLKTAQAKIVSLEQLIANLPAKIVTQEAEGPSAAFDGMRQSLYQLEVQEQDLAAKMHDNHPKLIALRQQVQDLRQILAGQPEQRVQSTEALNPARQSLELSFLTESSNADSLRARERSLIGSQQQLRSQLQELNTQAIAIDQLQQQIALHEANHKDYAQKLEQARINRSLDEERISSLSLVQPASYIATATGPRRMHVLALGMALALLSGLGTAFIAAWLNPLIATAEQLATILDLPLVGVMPPGTPRTAVAA